MKKITFTGLLAFAVILGINAKTEKEKEPTSPVVIGGPTNYPHSTGMCYCGQYVSCHPNSQPRYEIDERSGQYIIIPPK